MEILKKQHSETNPFYSLFLIQDFLNDYQGQWGFAGGWAIDLFLNRQTRYHKDIEIAIWRKDQFLIQDYFRDWDLQYVSKGVLSPWKKNTFIELPIHEIHAFHRQTKNACGNQLEILMNETKGEDWIFRRNPNVRLPVNKLFIRSVSGLPILCPEVVLLYKAKINEAKDKQDFQNTYPLLSVEQKEWLDGVLGEKA